MYQGTKGTRLLDAAKNLADGAIAKLSNPYARHFCNVLVGMLHYQAKRRLQQMDPCDIDPRVTYSGTPLGFHYIHHQKWRKDPQRFDERGFVSVRQEGRDFPAPVLHCYAALQQYHDYLETEDAAHQVQFLKLVEVLMTARSQIQVQGTPCDVWLYYRKSPEFMPHSIPWISCIAQGMAMSVLARAYEMTGETRYLQCAKASAGVFDFDIDQGGVRTRDEQGHWFYHEYPFRRGVLNGFIYSLFGLYDVYRVSQDAKVKEYFDEGIATLRSDGMIDRWDLGWDTKYEPTARSSTQLPSDFYTWLQARQMLALYRITGDPRFREKAYLWRAYVVRGDYRFRRTMAAAATYGRRLPRYFGRLLRAQGAAKVAVDPAKS